MARLHGVVATVLALIALIFYIIGMASSHTYDTGASVGVTSIGPWQLCYSNSIESDCKLPDTKCEVTVAGTGKVGIQALPKCQKYNAYRAFIVIAFALAAIGFIIMIYTTFRTGAWTAYLVGSAFVGASAVCGLITMAIAADYKNDLTSEFPGFSFKLAYGFVLPLIAWIIQIPACIIFSMIAK